MNNQLKAARSLANRKNDSLESGLPLGASVEYDLDAPLPYAVYLDGELLGAGNSKSRAVSEAKKYLSGQE